MKALRTQFMFALVLPVAAHAQNLVGNADFDSDLGQWSVGNDGGSVEWDGTMGSPAPGSAHLTAGAGVIQTLTQCVSLPSALASSISLSADVYMFADSNSTSNSPYGVETAAYAGTTCSDAVFYGSNFILQPVGTTAWTAVSNNFVSIPGGYQSMLVKIFVEGGLATADYSFDHLVLTQVTDRILGTGFDPYEGFQ